jgi:hypothetical protein
MCVHLCMLHHGFSKSALFHERGRLRPERNVEEAILESAEVRAGTDYY